MQALLLVVVAVAMAAEEPVRQKKDVFIASPYAAVSYAYDDGSYYPGKYERAAYVAAAVPAAVPAVSHSVAYPAVSAYSAYPYAYSALPYRTVVV